MIAALNEISETSSFPSRRAYLSQLHQKVHQLLPGRTFVFVLLLVL